MAEPELEKIFGDVWLALGNVVSVGISRLKRDAGLAICAGLASGELKASFEMNDIELTCTIARDGEVVYSFSIANAKGARLSFEWVESDTQRGVRAAGRGLV